MTDPTTTDTVTEARERLVSRARRDGLATVGYRVVASPLGPLWIGVGPRGVVAISYGGEPDARDLRRIVATYGPGVVPDPRRIDPIARELDEYFRGGLERFETPFDLSGLTPFQRRVLRATARVRYGDLITYGTVARRVGAARAARAVGGAVGSNPIPILVPCHRVVATDGTLGGYGGGLETKRRLLALERGEVPRGGWPSRRS